MNTALKVDVASDVFHRLAEQIKGNLRSWDAKSARSMMQRHLSQMRLIDADGKWSQPELARFENSLLPTDLDINRALEFVDQMTKCEESNGYLRTFLEAAQGEVFDHFQQKYKEEGDKFIPDVIAYAFVLDRLVGAIHEDPTVLLACFRTWQNVRKWSQIGLHMTPFDFAKLTSVEGPIKRFIECHNSGQVSPDLLRTMLSVNIMEAVATDVVMGNFGNAKAGFALAVNPPGGSHADISTGAGPSQWSNDKKAILFVMPKPMLWADLYQTWNMCFVSHFEYFPYVLAKLFIPRVSAYQDCPEQYIYYRALALYLHLHFTYLGRVAGNSPQAEMKWADRKLTALWGKVNAASSDLYSQEVKKAKSRS